jgi:hypothetical protein
LKNIVSISNSNSSLLEYANKPRKLNTAPIIQRITTAKLSNVIIIDIIILIHINIIFLNPPKNAHLAIAKIEIIPNIK